MHRYHWTMCAALIAFVPLGCGDTAENVDVQQWELAGDGVSGLTLINADTDQPISGFDPLASGATLNLAVLPTRHLNMRANTVGTVASVRFDLDATTNFRTENTAPYALAGNSGPDYAAWTPSLGSHTVKATAFSASGGTGTVVGTTLTLPFTVTDSATPPTQGVTGLTLINADS